MAEDVTDRPSFDAEEQTNALDQPGPQEWMVQISGGFFPGRDREMLCQRAVSEAFDLREDKPHPMSSLPARSQFRAHRIEHRVLRVDEALQVVRIAHFAGLIVAREML